MCGQVLVESGTPSGRAKSYLLELLQAPITRSGTGDMTARLLRLLRMLLPRLQSEGGEHETPTHTVAGHWACSEP